MSNHTNPVEIVESIVADQLKGNDDLPMMSPGDTIDVHYRIIEGEKERIQIFQGVLLSMNNKGINRTITVRRIVANEGVERIFPLHSPRIARIDVIRRGDARRAKLYFLRDRIGKSRRLRDQRRGQKHIQAWETTHTQKVAEAKQAAKDAEKNRAEEQDAGK